LSNLYIWFATVTERRDFVLQLLEIRGFAEQNGTTKKEKEQLEDLELHLDLLVLVRREVPTTTCIRITLALHKSIQRLSIHGL